MRDFVESWYKAEISSKEDFTQTIKSTIHNAIRYVNLW